ncbi:MAG TPA: tetratricopeptide repeat protein [Burkholderiales bacterium]|nr:tetratricopeptide repeat protein [Burkholderiales bacterium]
MIAVAARYLICHLPVVLFLFAAAGSGATAKPSEEPLPNPILAPGAPWAFDGFIVNAPSGEDWASFSKDMRSAELGKKFDDGHSAAVVIVSRRYDDSIGNEKQLLAIVRREESAPPEPKFMKLMDFADEAYSPKGALCARSKARFEDRRPQYSAPGTLAIRSITCARPDRPEIVVALRFAERFTEDDGPKLGELAEQFLDGLRFVVPAGALIARARDAVGNKRTEEAVATLAPAAAQGDSEAALFLGNIYLYGSGVGQDLDAARKYLELAARDGRRDALYNLGAIYDKGIGVERNVQEAIKWFTRAADQRDAQAQLNLALFYMHGDGVPKDLRTAEEWLRRAAGNGNKRAAGMLASGRFKQQ